MTLLQRRNRLTTNFSERIPVDKRRIFVYKNEHSRSDKDEKRPDQISDSEFIKMAAPWRHVTPTRIRLKE